MYNSEKYYEDVMPQLVPLEKEKKIGSPTYTGKSVDEGFRIKPEEGKGQSVSGVQQIRSPDLDRVASKKMDDNIKKRHHDLQKRNEVSKNLITQMINKISLRSIAEQNYPVSNETIERLLLNLDQQIEVLTQESGKFQNSLLLNPTNQHIKKELQSLQKSLNQMKTIRQLYQQKIDNRGKISELQGKIMDLKAQNRELKIKISRGIQKIQSHIHNLPCERQKQLIEQVNKYKLSLNREREMRQNLQNNISTIVLNFQRFYTEADNARLIVTERLRLASQKQHELNIKLENLNHQKNKNGASMDIKSIKLDSNLQSSQPFLRRVTNRITDEQNMAEIINQMNLKERQNQRLKEVRAEKQKNQKFDKWDKAQEIKKGRDKIGVSQLGSTIPKREPSQVSHGQWTLEEQIQKMRTNQRNFKKITQKRT